MSDNIWHDNQEIPEEIEQELETPAQRFTYLTQEVMRRFERAKLYETLLKHDLFERGSADPETVDSVEQEIKAFVTERIEILMGIKQAAPAPSSDLFSSDEVQALKLLASRMIAKNPGATAPKEPSLNTPPAPPEPSIRMVQARAHHPKTAQQSRSVSVGQPPPPKKPVKRRKSENVSEVTGQDLSQAGNPAALPMPSQEEINAITAQQAHSVMSKGKAMMGSDDPAVNLGSLISSVAKHAATKGE